MPGWVSEKAAVAFTLLERKNVVLTWFSRSSMTMLVSWNAHTVRLVVAAPTFRKLEAPAAATAAAVYSKVTVLPLTVPPAPPLVMSTGVPVAQVPKTR